MQQPLLLTSFLAAITIDIFPLFDFPCDSAGMQQNQLMFIMIIMLQFQKHYVIVITLVLSCMKISQ